MQNMRAPIKAQGMAPRNERGNTSRWPQEFMPGVVPSSAWLLQPGMISPPHETTQEPGSSLFHFLCKPQASFSVICQGGTAAGPHITGTGWRQRHGSTYETAAAGTNRDEKPWEKKQVWSLQHPHFCLTKGLPYLHEILVQQEPRRWSVIQVCWGVWTSRPVLTDFSSPVESPTDSKNNLGCDKEIR